MKDKELYDFFRERKQVFDEAPGNALWSRIETGLADSAPVATPSKFPFLRTLLYSIMGVSGIATIWFALSGQGEKKAVPETKTMIITKGVGPKFVNEVTTVNDVGFGNQSVMTDSVKKKKLPVIQKETTPVSVKISPFVFTKTDSVKFDVGTVQYDMKKMPGRINLVVKQMLTKNEFDLFVIKVITDNANTESLITVKAPGHKTFRQVLPSKGALIVGERDSLLKPEKMKIDLIDKEQLMPQLENILIVPVYNEKKRNKTGKKPDLKKGSLKKSSYGEVIIAPLDSVIFDSAKVKTEVLKARER